MSSLLIRSVSFIKVRGEFRTPSYLSTAQKMTFSIKDFFSKCNQVCKKLRLWSHLLKKSLMKTFIFCAVQMQDFMETVNDLNLLKLLTRSSNLGVWRGRETVKYNCKDTRNMSVVFWRLCYLMCFEQISHTIHQFTLLIMDIHLGSMAKYSYLQN